MIDPIVPTDLYTLENDLNSWGKLLMTCNKNGCKVELKTRKGFVFRDYADDLKEGLRYVYSAVVQDLWTRCERNQG